MKTTRPPRLSRSFFAEKGAKGGASSTPAKREAARRNLARTPTHVKRAESLGPPEPKRARLPDPPPRHD